jgi:hypothetical protein
MEDRKGVMSLAKTNHNAKRMRKKAIDNESQQLTIPTGIIQSCRVTSKLERTQSSA